MLHASNEPRQLLKCGGSAAIQAQNSNKQDYAFIPTISLFINCDNNEEINRLFEHLSEGGAVLLPLSPLPMSEKFGWVQDKYGVSWQLNLAKG